MIYGDNPGENPAPDIAAVIQSGNLYAYCMGNPIRYSDPEGNAGIAVAMTLLSDAFSGNGEKKDYSDYGAFVGTLHKSPLLQAKIHSHLEEFKDSGQNECTYEYSVSFYGNDLDPNDLDLHLAVGKAEYTMNFKKVTEEKKFLWATWTETSYVVEITVSDIYNFDEYRESISVSNTLNNWGYDMQQEGNLTPFRWSVTFTLGGLK